MMKTLLCSLIFLAFAAQTQAETKLNYAGDAYVRAYFRNTTGNTGNQAFNQFFRFNVIAKPDDNLSIKAGLILSSNTWEGDNHRAIYATTAQNIGTAMGGTNDDGFSNDNVTRLDHAIIEYKKDGWITSVGRHVVSTPGNFLTSDDRRDRIQVIKFRENFDAFALVFDKRAEGSLTDRKDDLNMYSANYYGSFSTFKYALQTGYWIAKEFGAASGATATSGLNSLNLDNVKQVTPQIEGKLGAIDMNFYYTLLFGGSANYKNDHHSAALKLAHDFEIFKVEVQSMVVRNGGLIASGFDSLSSIVNSSPDHNQSSIRLKVIGFGLGNNNADEALHMARFSRVFSETFAASVGGGWGEFYTGPTTTMQQNALVDATAKYTFSPNLNLQLAYGHFFDEYKDHAGSLTLKANF